MGRATLAQSLIPQDENPRPRRDLTSGYRPAPYSLAFWSPDFSLAWPTHTHLSLIPLEGREVGEGSKSFFFFFFFFYYYQFIVIFFIVIWQVFIKCIHL